MIDVTGNIYSRFIVNDDDEMTGLELIKKLQGNQTILNDELKNKTDLYGDHKGSWQGLQKPTLSEEGAHAQVEKNMLDIIDINNSLDKQNIIITPNNVNDTENIINLINDNKNIIFSDGIFYLDSSIIITNIDNIFLKGSKNTIIKYLGDEQIGIEFRECNNLKIHNVNFMNDDKGSERVDVYFLRVVGGKNNEITNNTFNTIKGMGVVFVGCENSIFTNNIINDTLADGVHFLECYGNIIISNNNITNTNDDGIAFNNYVNTTLQSYGCIIENNKINNTGVGRGILINGSDGIKVINNSINTTGSSGILIGKDEAFGVVASKNIIVTNNNVINSGIHNMYGGIMVGIWGVNGKVYNNENENIILCNNIVSGCKGYSVDLYSVKGIIFNNNLITNTNTIISPIYATSLLIGGVEGYSCSGNIFRETTRVDNAIHIFGGDSYGVICNNVSENTVNKVISYSEDIDRLKNIENANIFI